MSPSAIQQRKDEVRRGRGVKHNHWDNYVVHVRDGTPKGKGHCIPCGELLKATHKEAILKHKISKKHQANVSLYENEQNEVLVESAAANETTKSAVSEGSQVASSLLPTDIAQDSVLLIMTEEAESSSAPINYAIEQKRDEKCRGRAKHPHWDNYIVHIKDGTAKGKGRCIPCGELLKATHGIAILRHKTSKKHRANVDLYENNQNGVQADNETDESMRSVLPEEPQATSSSTPPDISKDDLYLIMTEEAEPNPESTHYGKEMSTTKIEKLNGKNFQCWQFRIRSLLGVYELEDVVFGRHTNTSSNSRNNEQLKNWKKRDSMAKLILSNNMTDEVLKNYVTCKTAADMWKKLIKTMNKTTEANVTSNFYLLRERILHELEDFKAKHINVSSGYDTHLEQRDNQPDNVDVESLTEFEIEADLLREDSCIENLPILNEIHLVKGSLQKQNNEREAKFRAEQTDKESKDRQQQEKRIEVAKSTAEVEQKDISDPLLVCFKKGKFHHSDLDPDDVPERSLGTVITVNNMQEPVLRQTSIVRPKNPVHSQYPRILLNYKGPRAGPKSKVKSNHEKEVESLTEENEDEDCVTTDTTQSKSKLNADRKEKYIIILRNEEEKICRAKMKNAKLQFTDDMEQANESSCKNKIKCPLCLQYFLEDQIVPHTSTCMLSDHSDKPEFETDPRKDVTNPKARLICTFCHNYSTTDPVMYEHHIANCSRKYIVHP